MEEPTAKACTKCREVKPLEAFSPGMGRYKRIAQCRDCKRKPPALRKPRARKPMPDRKKCSRCALMLPSADFGLSSGRLASQCRKCHNSLTREWQRKNPERSSAATARRRARKRQASTVPFTPVQQAQRAMALGDRCWMCGTAKWSHWDHVKPLAKGGAHCLANLRPACAWCNQSKGDKWLGAAWANSLRA